MSSFGGILLTNRGRNLQAKAQAGAPLIYTRIGIGDGQLGTSPIFDLTDLKHQVMSLSISKLKVMNSTTAVIGTIMNNNSIQSGFYFREIGIFATDPDLGEILYCYGNAGALAEYIPPGGGADIVEKAIDIQVLTGNAANISAIIDQSLIFETPAGAQEKADGAEEAAKNYSDEKLTTHMAEKATTTGYGHTILNPTITSTSNNEAATAGAVKAVADIANTKAPASHTHTIGQVTGLQTELDKKINESLRNQANGFVGLDSSGKLPTGLSIQKVKIADIDMSISPAIEYIINDLENYTDVEVYIENVKTTYSGVNPQEIQVLLNDNTATTVFKVGMSKTITTFMCTLLQKTGERAFQTWIEAGGATHNSSSNQVSNLPLYAGGAVLLNNARQADILRKVTLKAVIGDASHRIISGKIVVWGVPK
ncbi:phage tail protein [Psychrobacillus sp.]|uniref:phage tail-collar fiber domain-containing protein n=1 Tax=Psychrobacillus sp. TaxID=1871623 RepID=UPI0028BDC921|nr:phage tail protein [Psychrobacillus sp.]